jgi:hypothetical protein
MLRDISGAAQSISGAVCPSVGYESPVASERCRDLLTPVSLERGLATS